MKIFRCLLIFGLILFSSLASLSCRQKTTQTAHSLTALATPPDWSRLEVFQETITREEFRQLLQNVYLLEQKDSPLIRIYSDYVLLQKSDHATDVFQLRFASAPQTQRPMFISSSSLPLSGLKIALDPGHIGGDWAMMERRWFRVRNFAPVAEGEITLRVAQHLKKKLEALGAQVVLVREDLKPVTALRPQQLESAARQSLHEHAKNPTGEGSGSLQEESLLLFYRVSEIRERARLINEKIRPDLTLCLHLNAGNWGDPKNPKFTSMNHLHLLVNGAYSLEELRYEDIRFEMLVKLLNRSHTTELLLAESIAQSLSKRTHLIPCLFPAGAVKKVGSNPYVWARNLMANRLYQSPVVYLEPYMMNHPEVYARLQAGDYLGRRYIQGAWRESLYEEYAQGVAKGVVRYRQGVRFAQKYPLYSRNPFFNSKMETGIRPRSRAMPASVKERGEIAKSD